MAPVDFSLVSVERERARHHGLDAVRGIAALSVLAFHIIVGRWELPVSAGVLRYLNVGVAIFFVLSAFLFTTWLLECVDGKRPLSVSGFARRRFTRLWPALAALLAGLLVLPLPSIVTPGTVGYDALLVRPYVYGGQIGGTPVLWSLTAEVAFYVTIALLAVGLVRRSASPRAARRLLAIFWASAALLSLLLKLHFGPEPYRDALYPFTLLWFALGAGLALARPRLGAVDWRIPAAAALASYLVIGMLVPTSSGSGTSEPLGVYVWFGVVAVLVVLTGILWHPPQRLWLVQAGVISYGIYLWHYPIVGSMTGKLPDTALGDVGFVVAVIVASVVAGLASWRLVERPCLRAADRRRRRLAPAGAARSRR